MSNATVPWRVRKRHGKWVRFCDASPSTPGRLQTHIAQDSLEAPNSRFLLLSDDAQVYGGGAHGYIYFPDGAVGVLEYAWNGGPGRFTISFKLKNHGFPDPSIANWLKEINEYYNECLSNSQHSPK